MKTMKRVVFLICTLSALACAADLAGIRRVYLLPMGRGLDQHLANSITNLNLFEVVTDPKLADAVFTDHLGEGFESQLKEFFPLPTDAKPEPPAKPADPEPNAKPGEEPQALEFMTNTENKLSNPAVNSSFGRSRGTIFLVDAKGRQVVWSTFQRPKGTSSTDLNRSASDIVSRLKKDLKK